MTDTPDLEVPDPDVCLYVDVSGVRCANDAYELRLIEIEPGIRVMLPLCEEHPEAPSDELARERMLHYLETEGA